jgi:LysM repeat protein
MKSSIYQFLLISVLLVGSAAAVWAAKPYKIYVINRYGAWDIVCDSYTVQKDDHIWDILRRKGSIAEEDFPRFVTILKGLNPGIKDVNKIYPSQKILVPLKQIEAKERPADSAPRFITIPMIPDILYKTHQVHSGEYLSRIVTAHLGVRWDEIPRDYFQTLKRLNPRIKNMDLIYPDQTIRIPALAAQEPPAAQPGPVASEVAMADEAATPENAMATAIPQALPAPVSVGTPVPEQGTPSWQEGLAEAMKQLGSKLLASGQCYFPEKDRGDVTLDLAAFPVIELQDGRHLLLETGKGLPKDIEEAARASWKDLVILRPDPGDPYDVVLDKVFRAMFGEKVQKVIALPAFDDGIQVTLRGDWILPLEARQGNQGAYQCITLIETPEESTSGPVVQYLAEANIQVLDIVSPAGKEKAAPFSKEKVLKDCLVLGIDGSSQEAFVSGFVSALGYSYDPHVPLSFDYAGFQVQTSANLIYGGRLADLVVDFGTFYGEAKSAVEAGGLRVLSIKPDEDLVTIAKQILAFTGTAYTEGPVFLAANRERSKAASLTIPGILISGVNEKRILLTQVRLHTRLCDFLMEKKIQPVQMRLVIE